MIALIPGGQNKNSLQTRINEPFKNSMSQALIAFNEQLIKLIKIALPSTVTIYGTSKDLTSESQGSGWIYAPDLVVTNYHVIEEMAEPLIIKPVGRTELNGKIIGVDPSNDIALIRVENLLGTCLEIETTPAQIGEISIAIGSPHAYRESVSLGIISGTSRQIRKSNNCTIEEMIQTDAAINPGNSGGPLINVYGRLIGMNTMGPAETVNMAVPAETITHVIPELLTHGSILRGSIGISISIEQIIKDDRVSSIVCVKKSKGTEENEIQKGDHLISINGSEIKRRIDVMRALNRETIGKEVIVELLREGIEKKIKIIPGELKK